MSTFATISATVTTGKRSVGMLSLSGNTGRRGATYPATAPRATRRERRERGLGDDAAAGRTAAAPPSATRSRRCPRSATCSGRPFARPGARARARAAAASGRRARPGRARSSPTTPRPGRRCARPRTASSTRSARSASGRARRRAASAAPGRTARTTLRGVLVKTCAATMSTSGPTPSARSWSRRSHSGRRSEVDAGHDAPSRAGRRGARRGRRRAAARRTRTTRRARSRSRRNCGSFHSCHQRIGRRGSPRMLAPERPRGARSAPTSARMKAAYGRVERGGEPSTPIRCDVPRPACTTVHREDAQAAARGELDERVEPRDAQRQAVDVAEPRPLGLGHRVPRDVRLRVPPRPGHPHRLDAARPHRVELVGEAVAIERRRRPVEHRSDEAVRHARRGLRGGEERRARRRGARKCVLTWRSPRAYCRPMRPARIAWLCRGGGPPRAPAPALGDDFAFSPAAGNPFETNSDPVDVIVADIDADGFPDAVLGDSFGSTISIFWGKSGEHVRADADRAGHQRAPPTSSSSPTSTATPTSTSPAPACNLQVFKRNNADPRTFAAGTAQTLDTEDDLEFLARRAWSPANFDGRTPTPTSTLRSAASSPSSGGPSGGAVRIFENDPTGTFTREPNLYKSIDYVGEIVVGTFDADSDPDLAFIRVRTTTRSATTMFISVRLGASRAHVRGRRPRSTSPTAASSQSADLDEDAHDDLVSTRERQRQLGERRRHVRPVRRGSRRVLPDRVLLRRLQQRRPAGHRARAAMPLDDPDEPGRPGLHGRRHLSPTATRTSAATARRPTSAATRATTSSSARFYYFCAFLTVDPSPRRIPVGAARRRRSRRPTTPATRRRRPPATPRRPNPPASPIAHPAGAIPPLTQPVVPVRANQIATLPSNRKCVSRRNFQHPPAPPAGGRDGQRARPCSSTASGSRSCAARG